MGDVNNNVIDIQDVKNALKNDEFKVYYQPQLNYKNEIVGVEALARWFSEKYGTISPDVFIPILEENNIIYDFQNYILDKACNEIKYITDVIGKNIKLSVNISPFQIENDNFVEDIDRIIKKNEFDYKKIELEITESCPLNLKGKLNKKLEEIKNKNISIALDDFGKGYTSIRYLLEFKFDNVKIDKKYVYFALDKPEFLDYMIKMIHSVGSKVVLEGVEDKNQFELLKELDYDVMQGYYFYKPLSFNELLQVV